MSGLVPVGHYVRDLGAGIERLIENVLDWEHLPHLHEGSFASIEPVAASATGWRATARLADGRALDLLLELDPRAASWITQSRIDDRLVSEIISKAEATGSDRCRVTVTFKVADVPEKRRHSVAARYQRLYAALYDEDERMMIARADALRRGPAALRETRPVTLADGSSHEAPIYCPHQGLPLDAEPDAGGVITCPWHGYRIDLRTGRCASPHALR